MCPLVLSSFRSFSIELWSRHTTQGRWEHPCPTEGHGVHTVPSRLCEKRDGGSWEVVVLLALLLLLFLTIFVIFTYCVRKNQPSIWINIAEYVILSCCCRSFDAATTRRRPLDTFSPPPHAASLWCSKSPTSMSYFHFHFFVIRIGSEGWGNRALQVNPSCSRLSSQSPGISTSFRPFIWGYR